MTPQFDIRDNRWVHGLLAILLAVVMFQLGAWRETDVALSLARQKAAEWAQAERVKIAAEEKAAAQTALDKQWPCKGFGISGDAYTCTLRGLR